MAQSKQRRFQWLYVALAVAGVGILVIGTLHNSNVLSNQQTPAEQAMSAALRPATSAEKVAALAADAGDAAEVFVAKRSFTTTAATEPLAIIVPRGIHWLGGKLGEIVLLRPADDSTTSDLTVYRDPLCVEEISWDTCTSFQSRQVVSEKEMLAHLRPATKSEEYHWYQLQNTELDSQYQPVYVATSDFVLAPKLWADNRVTIVVPKGVIVQGGQLGQNSLYFVSEDLRRVGSRVVDQFCRSRGDAASDAVLRNWMPDELVGNPSARECRSK